jgi:hypothetical protein
MQLQPTYVANTEDRQALSTSYHTLSSNYKLPSWNPHGPTATASPLKPSNTTLELESGKIDHVPANLTKATPNFHLLMLAIAEDDKFCKTTLSAMMLNYPPPTILNLYDKFDDVVDAEQARLEGVLRYLRNTKMVKDEDLVLLVDGRDTWFQLPSDVLIRQYHHVLQDGNKRLANKFGGNHTQTIVFGAVKACEGDDPMCRYFPWTMLPQNLYGKETGKEVQRTPARYLNSEVVIGPAKDLRVLYEAAVKMFEEEKSQQATTQSVMATIFGEQEMMRQAQRKKTSKVVPSKWLDYFDGLAAEVSPEEHERYLNATQQGYRFEFKIGLDYTHTLFQPLLHCTADELVPLVHDNLTDLSRFHHLNTPTPPLTIPVALQQARLPFWTPNFHAHNPSPNEKSAYIDKLEYNDQLDRLKPRDTTWEQIKLVQNTYTGAVPAIFHANNRSPSQLSRIKRKISKRPSAGITWKSLWYFTYERALLRKYFRSPQSPVGYHTAAIGGDRLWDTRGGRGGVWTEKEALWLPWGEVDGVCGNVRQIKNVFADGKGVWLHELDDGKGEEQREREEQELRDRILEKEKKNREKEEQRIKDEEEARKQEQEQKEKDKQDAENELRMKVDEEKKKEDEQRVEEEAQKVRGEEAEVERLKQEKEQKAYEEGQDLLEFEGKGEDETAEDHEDEEQKHPQHISFAQIQAEHTKQADEEQTVRKSYTDLEHHEQDTSAMADEHDSFDKHESDWKQ